MNIRQRQLISLAAVAALVSACATHLEPNSALEHAHARYNAAAGNAQVSSVAAPELQRAADKLHEADKAWKDHEPASRVEQMAYLSSQRVSIAEDAASARAAEAATAQAAAERDRLRLAARTNEADTAKAQAAAAEATTAAVVAAADAKSDRDQARIARRDAQLADMQAQLQDLQTRKTDRGMVVTLGDVLFETGKANLLPTSERNMDKLATYFKTHPEQRAIIEGYTDSVGSASYNQGLSERRARAVMSALVALGVPPDRLTTHAYGEDQPVATNATATGRAQNRRVEVLFPDPPTRVSQR